MRRLALLGLLSISCFVLVLFVLEGARDKQNLKSVLEVGGKTLRDVAETATSPIKVSSIEETRLGRRLVRYFRRLPANHPDTQRVRRIGRRLAKHRKRRDILYQFDVLPSASPNAFALPGGFVMITTGLLQLASTESDDAELAWVLSHEITHIEKRHALVQMRISSLRRKLGLDAFGAGQLVQLLQSLVQLSYSENMELEADLGGLSLMQKADFNSRRALQLIDRMLARAPRQSTTRQSRNPFLIGVTLTQNTISSYLATHPHWEERKKRLLVLLKHPRQRR